MNRRNDGFTLIELLVVLAIIAIMLGIAAPSFVSFISNYRATTAINDVLQGIALTRSEALKRGRRVTLAPITGDWHNGWTVFVDAAGSGSHNQSYDPGEELIFQHDPLPASIVVGQPTAAAMPFADPVSGHSFVAFDGTGYARSANGSAVPLGGYGITISDSLSALTQVRTLCMQAAGRPHIVKDTVANACANG